MMPKIIKPRFTLFVLLPAVISTGLYLSTQDQGGIQAAEPSPPNILLVISDDFGLDVTSGMYPDMIDNLVRQYGPEGLNNPDYREIDGRPASTPVLNELARESMLFTNVWAHPFCSPTRASILTGLNTDETRVLTYADPLSSFHTSFVRLLKEQGSYSTAVFGKWHVAGLPGRDVSYPGMKPKEAGFDVFRGNLHAAITTYWDYDYEVQDEHTTASEWRTEKPPVKSLPGIAPTTFAPVVKIADAIEWIKGRETENPDKPWFAWVAFNLSHATRNQQPSAMAVPNADTLDAVSYKEMKDCGGEFGTNNTGTCSGESLMRAMTNAMDTITGKLLEAVDAIDPNTYVIYISDNGTPMYNRPNLDFIDNMYITREGRGKGTAFESGVRVPLAIRGPGIQAGSRNDQLIAAADIFPTALSLAGVRVPDKVSNAEGTGTIPLDSMSLVPLLEGKNTTLRDPDRGYLLTATRNLMTGGTEHVGARNASHKMVCIGGISDDFCQFYDLDRDPLEEYPLSKPASCSNFDSGTWTPADQVWHYCELANVITTKSF